MSRRFAKCAIGFMSLTAAAGSLASPALTFSQFDRFQSQVTSNAPDPGGFYGTVVEQYPAAMNYCSAIPTGVGCHLAVFGTGIVTPISGPSSIGVSQNSVLATLDLSPMTEFFSVMASASTPASPDGVYREAGVYLDYSFDFTLSDATRLFAIGEATGTYVGASDLGTLQLTAYLVDLTIGDTIWETHQLAQSAGTFAFLSAQLLDLCRWRT